jgi:antitoxin (DNA-binding transcriptional repressor) of toxin-antitoxin stability system
MTGLVGRSFIRAFQRNLAIAPAIKGKREFCISGGAELTLAIRDDTSGRRIDLKEIQNNFSRFLAGVKAGEAVEKGRPIARIVKEPEGRGAVYSALSDLVEKGIVVLPGKSMDKEEFPAVETSGKPVSDMVVEDRR